jgi:hypothetical protein
MIAGVPLTTIDGRLTSTSVMELFERMEPLVAEDWDVELFIGLPGWPLVRELVVVVDAIVSDERRYRL